MNINQLKYFQAVYLYGNVSRAAEALYISQPSLSESIRALEEEFGVSLFDRQHRGMKPTAAGDQLYTLSRTLLDDASRIERIMGELGRDRRTIRIGITPMVGAVMMPEIIKDFFMAHPETRLEVLEPNREDLMKEVENGMIDLAFVVHQDSLPGSFESFFVSDLEIGCAVHPADPLAGRKQLTPRDLGDHKVVMFANGYYHTQLLRQYFEAEGVQPDLLLQTSQLSTVVEMVRSRLAIGFLFKEMSGDFPDLVYIPFETPICVGVSMIWSPSAGHFKEMDEFIAFIKTAGITKID